MVDRRLMPWAFVPGRYPSAKRTITYHSLMLDSILRCCDETFSDYLIRYIVDVISKLLSAPHAVTCAFGELVRRVISQVFLTGRREGFRESWGGRVWGGQSVLFAV